MDLGPLLLLRCCLEIFNIEQGLDILLTVQIKQLVLTEDQGQRKRIYISNKILGATDAANVRTTL